MGRVGRVVSVVFSFAVIAGSVYVFFNHQAIQDQISLIGYTPSSQVKALADETTMTDYTREVFYASHPSIDDKQAFNQHCTNNSEQTIVLGCYNGRQIYLYNVNDPRLPHVQDVTAAHETLHAVYQRLSSADKAKVDAMVQTQLKTITDQRILDLIQLYNKTEPGELLNEMHSILGTEYRNLNPDLENYYKQYFGDREQIVTYSEQYETVFTASKQRIADYDSQLGKLKSQIDANEASLSSQQSDLEQQSNQLNSLRQSDPQAYNAAVPSYNAQAQSYNDLLSQTRDLVDQYNQIVEKRNAEVASQQDLVESLDSHFQPAQQN